MAQLRIITIHTQPIKNDVKKIALDDILPDPKPLAGFNTETWLHPNMKNFSFKNYRTTRMDRNSCIFFYLFYPTREHHPPRAPNRHEYHFGGWLDVRFGILISLSVVTNYVPRNRTMSLTWWPPWSCPSLMVVFPMDRRYARWVRCAQSFIQLFGLLRFNRNRHSLWVE